MSFSRVDFPPDLAWVKRYGRWLSDAFQGYLWDSHDQFKGLAKAMSEDKSELTAPR